MRIILILSLVLIASCASTTNTDNPTVYPYEHNAQLQATLSNKKVIFAPVSLGIPAPSWLATQERKTRAMARNYIENQGYEILPNYHFDNAWKQANRTYGNVYNPSTGRIDAQAWQAAMVTTGQKIQENTDAQLIIFADLLVHDVQHSASMKHYARWYGVTRSPELRGSADEIPSSFDWSKPLKAASLMVTIYDVNLNRVFTSRGGIDTLEFINTRKANPVYARSKRLLKNDGNIEEGIELAFHPFIKMRNYPGPDRSANIPAQ